MFKHLLVPLDGSSLAEVSLPVAALLSSKLDAEVTLLHIIEKDAPQEIHGDRHLTDEDEACKYLDAIATRYFPEGVASCHIHTEKVQDVARSIADHTGELAPDLIVMCTHGEGGGLRDFMVGNIAENVIGMGKTPILLVHPEPGAIKTANFQKIVVALDGKPEHDGALPVAAELAQKLGCELHLLTVIPTLGTLSGERAATGWMLPGATRAVLDMDAEATEQHLENLAQQWRKKGLIVITAIYRGDPVQQIVAGSEALEGSLIVLTTHGKSGMKAFWSSSVGPKVVSSTHIPLLLIPLQK